jgi:hypothetical protein
MLVGKGDAFADGVELVVEAMLQSPHFLYRTELGTTVVNGRVNLSGFEVASRLSYGITNSMPDEQLFAAAQGNKLTRDDVVNHARRLLDSERGKATLADLHEQMFKLTDYGEVKRDVAAFPEFRPEMGPDIKTEAHTFLEQVVFGQNKGVEELLTAPYTYVNGRLAPLYGANVPASQTRSTWIRSSARVCTRSSASWPPPPPTTPRGRSSAACTSAWTPCASSCRPRRTCRPRTPTPPCAPTGRCWRPSPRPRAASARAATPT